VEARFFRELSKRVRGLDEWYHQDADGTPWMMVSHRHGAPGGLSVDCVTGEEAVEIAAEWFRAHIARENSRSGRGSNA